MHSCSSYLGPGRLIGLEPTFIHCARLSMQAQGLDSDNKFRALAKEVREMKAEEARIFALMGCDSLGVHAAFHMLQEDDY